MANFILEIGTEEIPARFLDDTQKELSTRFNAALNEAELSFTEIFTFASPRRASIFIKNLADKQELKEEIFLGPAKKIAYNEDGSLSKAALGFARGHKVEESDIFLTTTEKGEYIAVKKQVGGKTAQEVLEVLCPQIILALPFPKRMRWNSYTLAYARPIHWLLALLDSNILHFKVGEVASSNTTCTHRIHGEKNLAITSIDEYFSTLEKQGIMIDSEKRKQNIIEKGDSIASKIQAKVLWKDALLDEVKGLVEHPVPLLADFDESFLELPKEVLLTSMESHQKSFGIESQDNKLLPHFLTVLNLDPKDIKVVKQGWERVLRARLEDARFFWKTDNALIESSGFNTWLEKLDKVIFLGPLGSMGDKSRRLEKLMATFAKKLSLNETLAAKAGRCAKADLVSAMVNEFDTLQGIMGGIYATRMQEKELGSAIREHYLPAGPETPVPSNDYAALLSLCDKADTLVGLFGLNNIPSGTADPYALRRSALGIARILRDKAWNFDIQEVFECAYSCYSTDIKWKLSKEECLEKVIEFYYLRVKNLFISENNDSLFVEAIMNLDSKASMSELALKLQALINFSSHEKYLPTVQSFKRISNIIRKQALSYTLTSNIDETLLENAEEKSLVKACADYSNICSQALENKDYKTCYEQLASISSSIDAFFESTMVMAEDEKTRQNRLNLLYTIQKPLAALADFSALQI